MNKSLSKKNSKRNLSNNLTGIGSGSGSSAHRGGQVAHAYGMKRSTSASRRSY
jgi:hypothetical protein